ncbi:MAG: thioredoxin [Candidatus Omnitrophica bacterium CG11_big_fil_rev_8_21_14_0_20_42_13]|uniref:Thioredoxin n=1 Tax=Candidatus Ghiorseimicrobium undicola TaxID=1974746 RepID=A0A2H0LVA9_9BACT|nr:MAG: thioredoxin [Candidatus Omnitrophica bacterium CG11_big_fil_rev_8_21_14_0_20_42_13]
MSLIHLSDGNFNQEVVSSALPVLVDFSASWCGPCKAIAPIVEELAEEYKGRLKVGKLDIDEGQDTASNYGIMSVPTLVIFKNGKVVNQVVGALSKQQLKQKIDSSL